ncbi:hypothetical protein G7Y31_03040 [Corynebacterium lizhenjunii]|uniref:Uncharacterized protein n=1 Tax=Corynebacterium lizhenjunii TaxID=2709394 RepID=A0A7T0PB22_9CORY|nr:hypothetical protein [Corynebacterium lizhenjunii]QPK79696.1 hypothetical protein G7Y31_03040 [Corynebacterium lizhenjunii]
MYRSKFVASVVCVAVVSSAVVAPAQALETSLSSTQCTVELTDSEKETRDKAYKPEKVKEHDPLPLKIKIKDANEALEKHEADLVQLDFEKSLADSDVFSDDAKVKENAQAIIAGVEAVYKLSPKYKKALKACAQSKTYNSAKDKDFASTDSHNTSSQMNQATANILYGLLTTAGLTVLAAFLLNGPGVQGLLKNFKLPF